MKKKVIIPAVLLTAVLAAGGLYFAHFQALEKVSAANARLLVDVRHNGLTVPAAVVQQGTKGPYAYVVNPDSTVAIRPIKVAQISDGQALIDSGLRANEQVVVDGQYKLQPGTLVTILHGQAAAEAAAQSALQAPIP